MENSKTKNDLVTDSRATSHMTSNATEFEELSYKVSNVHIVNGQIIQCKGVGTAKIVYNGEKPTEIKFQNPLIMPELEGNSI